ncbi:MAG: N-acetylmuramoyl-L-alanine amidase [Lachnospiraceae bacterium]|nr:N-acetylmuramoyl-L-alanine amidase [Lachnospiraceae bacterium]
MKSKYRILLLVLFLLCVTAMPARSASAASDLSTAQIDSSLHLFVMSAAGTGWQYKDGRWYYYDPDGSRHTGWLYDHGTWYYLDGSGVMQTGWLNDRGTWYFLDRSGAMKTGWLYDGAWYYLTGSGAMKTGWLYDGAWYYLTGSGAMKTGWLNDRGTWYFLDRSGAMKTGWLYDGAWYYLTRSGAMKTGWQYVGGKWYFLDGSGAMKTGWLYDQSKWYFLRSDGAMLTGWQQIGGQRYYLNPSGDMADGFRIINGKACYFGSDGALKEDWASKNVIVIDPGHSSQIPDGQVPLGPGSDEMRDADNYGAVSVTNGLHEYELVLDVSLRLKDKLEARGYKVVMVRTTNSGKYSCVDRAKVANDNNAALFLRVHANAAPKDHSKNGAMTICITKDNDFVPAMYKKSRLLSDLILNNYVAAVGCYNEGVWERDDMIANNWSKVPTTLVELGYMTNEREDQLMQTSAYKEKMVNGLLNGIDAYFKATVK